MRERDNVRESLREREREGRERDQSKRFYILSHAGCDSSLNFFNIRFNGSGIPVGITAQARERPRKRQSVRES